MADVTGDVIRVLSELGLVQSSSSGGVTPGVRVEDGVLMGPDGAISVASYSWATKPDAATNQGVTIRITDYGGTAGSRWISDGTYWKPESGHIILANSAVAVTAPLDTAENILATVDIPALLLGSGGLLRVFMSGSWTNSANSKTWRLRFGGIGGTIYQAQTMTTTLTGRFAVEIQNRGATNSQVGGTPSGNGTYAIAAAALVTSAVDTSAATTLVITGQKATGAESFVLERYSVEVINP